MRNDRILTASIATLCFSVLSAPVLAQSDRNDWSDRSQSAVAARATSMRAGPEQGYPTVRNIARGGRVTIHGCLDDRSWCDASYGNDRGWVTGSDFAARYQGRDESISTLSGSFSIGTVTFSFGDYWENYYRQRPFYSERYRWEQHYFDRYQPNWGPRPERSYWGQRTFTGYMLRQSWLRAGPDYDYPSLRRLSRNTQVSVYGCLRDWSWCDVSYRRDRGWVPGRDIAASYQGRRRSINTIAPYLGIGILSFSFGIYWDDHYRDRTFYRERDRWERQYNQNYRPSWGPRQDDGRDRVHPRRDEQQQRQGPAQLQQPVQRPVPSQPPVEVRPPVPRPAPGQEGRIQGQPPVQRPVPSQPRVEVRPPAPGTAPGQEGRIQRQPPTQKRSSGQGQGADNNQPDDQNQESRSDDQDRDRTQRTDPHPQ